MMPELQKILTPNDSQVVFLKQCISDIPKYWYELEWLWWITACRYGTQTRCVQ